MYIPPFYCGVFVGALSMLAAVIALCLYIDYRQKQRKQQE